jgi:surface carbohydrate biosynthesis protein (TIGR04326 family)
LLNYDHEPEEFDCSRAKGGLPLPDIVATNGPAGREKLGWHPRIEEVEALRYAYLVSRQKGRSSTRARRVLVAGSIKARETRQLLNMVADAAPAIGAVEIWFKDHPTGSMGAEATDLFKRTSARWTLREDPISQLLEQAGVVVVPSSAVSVEAVAAGCWVVQPVWPDAISASPLDGFDDVCIRVSNPEQLAATLCQLIQSEPPVHNRVTFATNYWTVDAALPRWRGVLGFESA